MFDVTNVRRDFPILSRQVNGKPLVYLDSGASAQKPQVVIDAVSHAYSMEYANVHRGLHFLSNIATEKYETVRSTVARFLNAASRDEIVLNSGTRIPGAGAQCLPILRSTCAPHCGKRVGPDVGTH